MRKKKSTYRIPSRIILVDILDPNRRVFILHLYIRTSKIQTPLTLTKYLIKRRLNESLAVEIQRSVSIASLLALYIVVVGCD